MRRALARLATGVLLAHAMASAAAACSRAIVDDTVTLDTEWRDRFRQDLSAASGVYLVRVQPAGPLKELAGVRLPCDQMNVPPPPPPPRANAKTRAAHARAERQAEAARERCAPEAVRVSVLETLKGPPRQTWLEQASLIDVVSEPPYEPLRRGPPATYAARVGTPFDVWCGFATARRMSSAATYLVFVHTASQPDVVPPSRISHAFLADSVTPFLAEARQAAGGPVR